MGDEDYDPYLLVVTTACLRYSIDLETYKSILNSPIIQEKLEIDFMPEINRSYPIIKNTTIQNLCVFTGESIRILSYDPDYENNIINMRMSHEGNNYSFSFAFEDFIVPSELKNLMNCVQTTT